MVDQRRKTTSLSRRSVEVSVTLQVARVSRDLSKLGVKTSPPGDREEAGSLAAERR